MTEQASGGRDRASQAWHEAAECLKVLAHPNRLKMLHLLLNESPLTVGELARRCGVSQPAASEHLRLMLRCGFLRNSRAGRTVLYEVAEPHLAQLLECIEGRFGLKME